MDSAVVIVTAWLGLGACGFAAGAVGVGLARRRLNQATYAGGLSTRSVAPRSSDPLPAPEDELVSVS